MSQLICDERSDTVNKTIASDDDTKKLFTKLTFPINRLIPVAEFADTGTCNHQIT
jgi:hypothetical protein